MPRYHNPNIVNGYDYKQDIVEFGDNLRSLRIKARLSLDDLARLLESDKSPLSKIENGGRIPRLDMVFRIMDALGASPEVLMPERFLKNRTDVEWEQLYTLYSRLPVSERRTAVRYIRAMLTGISTVKEDNL